MDPVRIEDLLTYRFLSSIEASPDGRFAAFVVKQADLESNDYASNLHVIDLDSMQSRQLTRSGKDTAFVWSDEGSTLAFLSKRVEEEGKAAVFRIRPDGGEAEQIALLPHRAELLVGVDDDAILYTARVPLEPLPEEADAEEEKDYEVAEEIPFWMNGKGFTNRKRVHLFRFDRDTEQAVDLCDPTLEVDSVDVSEARVVLAGRRFDGIAGTDHEVWILDVAEDTRRRLETPALRIDSIRWLDARRLIAVASDMVEFGLGQNREVYTIDAATGEARSITPGWDRSVGSSIVGDCRHGAGPVIRLRNGRILLTVTERTHGQLLGLGIDGSFEVLAASPGSIDAYDVCGDLVLSIELRPGALQEVYAHRADGSEAVTDLNAAFLEGRAVSVPEPFLVTSPDGLELDAWVLRPPEFDPAKPYPTVLTIHGGPRAAYGEVFFHQMQAMAGLGYVILFSNPRGGSGRGNAFADVRGKYGTIDYDDLMAVVDTALERFDFVDADRLGVMGGSYGGFMTNWIIGHTDRFRAAVSQRSIANWVHKFCTTDIGYYFNRDQLGTTPWEEGGSEKLWWHSPLRYADRAVTPTLFIHSEQDYRCWLPEGIQMFTALRYHGVEARLTMFRGENHELSRSGKPKHRLRRLNEIVAWFDRHLKGAPAT